MNQKETFQTTKIIAMNKVLDQPFKRGVCPKCGKPQTHSLRYCSACGGEFFRRVDWSLIDALKFAQNRQFSSVPLIWLHPTYIAAVYLKDIDISARVSENEFLMYINEKLQIT
jgi:hypothetical protein